MSRHSFTKSKYVYSPFATIANPKMSIPNLPSLYKKIGRATEGGHEFARIITLLLQNEYNGYYKELRTIDDSAGDLRKADAFLSLNHYEDPAFRSEALPSRIILFQFKFFPSPLSIKHRDLIAKSAQEAMEHNPDCTEWILVTPDDLNAANTIWLEQLQTTLEASKGDQRPPVKIGHWGHTYILNLMLKHVHIGRQYYPEIGQNFDLGRLIIENVRLDLNQCAWEKSGRRLECYGLDSGYPVMEREWKEYRPWEEIQPSIRASFQLAFQLLKRRQPSLMTFFVKVEEFYLAILGLHNWLEEVKIPKPTSFAIETVVNVMREGWPTWYELKTLLPNNMDEVEWFHRHFGRVTDPIVELTIVNRSPNVQIIRAAGFIVHDVWRDDLGGPGPVASTVPILAEISIPVKYGKGKFLKDLDDPIQLPSQSSVRILLRMKDMMDIYPAIYNLAVSYVVDTSCGEVESMTVELAV